MHIVQPLWHVHSPTNPLRHIPCKNTYFNKSGKLERDINPTCLHRMGRNAHKARARKVKLTHAKGLLGFIYISWSLKLSNLNENLNDTTAIMAVCFIIYRERLYRHSKVWAYKDRRTET